MLNWVKSAFPLPELPYFGVGRIDQFLPPLRQV